jgi:hypothetical protein
MADVVDNENVANQEKVYKTKDYVRRAKLKYELKKYAEDPEYKTKRLESCKKSHQKNPEKYREYSKLYMREYRKRKALIKATESPQQQPAAISLECKIEYAKESVIDTISENIDTLKI